MAKSTGWMAVATKSPAIDYQNKVRIPWHHLHIQCLMGRYDEMGGFEQGFHDQQAQVKWTSACGVP